MPSGSNRRWSTDSGLLLTSPDQVESFASTLDECQSKPVRKTSNGRTHRDVPSEDEAPSDGDDDPEEDGEDEEDEDEDESSDDSEYLSADSVPSSPTPGPSRSSSPAPLPSSSPAHLPPSLTPHPSVLSLAFPPSELSPNFPTHSLLRTLAACASSLTHLSIAHIEPLLAHDPAIGSALAALPCITHLCISELGPKGSELVRDLRCRLQEAELNFDDRWVATVLSSPTSAPGQTPISAFTNQGPSCTLVPPLPNGQSSGLPTPAPTPATTPAAARATPSILPDPVPLLAHSMETLRVLRASNALIVTVADTLRYPAVRSLALRIAGVPTVTPLVHAFPGAAEVYVYTPYDGCGVRTLIPPPPSHPTAHSTATDSNRPIAQHKPAPLPPIEATREANRTSQLYSSFPPLARLRGFAPGLYALGLTCPVRHVELGAVAPPLGFGRGLTEAEMARMVLGDTAPTRVGLTLGRGWWAQDGVGEWTGDARRREREALRSLFDSGEDLAAGTGAGGGASVKELVVRVEEVGRWTDVTRDLAALLKPLAGALTLFALCWDRTSVPFDRAPPDDDPDAAQAQDKADCPSSANSSGASVPGMGMRRSVSATSTTTLRERAESFARTLAADQPALRYVCMEIVHDAPPPTPAPAPRIPPSRSSSGQSEKYSPPLQSPNSIWSAEAQSGVAEAVAAATRGKSSPSPSPLLPSPSPLSPATIAETLATPKGAESPTPTVKLPPGPPPRRVERRFWRVEREGLGHEQEKDARWLCLDPLDERAGRKVLEAADGLSFEDGVRY
ncbi:hypothetical protein GY45DRAFT_1341420 [Cubamyces sp. BRFM 1775]|nr:hypothetical protein GY45DRAFT_1341420 [Cubamyces sp. BRFM 1775]